MIEGKRIAILAEGDFVDSELTEPLRVMKDVGARLRIMGGGSKKSYEEREGL